MADAGKAQRLPLTQNDDSQTAAPEDSQSAVFEKDSHAIDQESNLLRHSLSEVDTKSTQNKEYRESYLLGRAKSFQTELNTELASRTKSETDEQCVRMTEIVPSTSRIFDSNEDENWRMSLDVFTSKRKGPQYNKGCTRRIKSYYKAQDELITAFENLYVEQDVEEDSVKDSLMKTGNLFAKISLAANIVLLIAKVVAAVLSSSIAIISSLVDSAVDFTSGVVIMATTRAVKNRNQYQYPQGRTKLEPIAIVILSVVMSVASLQLIRESIEKCISLSRGEDTPPNMDTVTIIITLGAIAMKLVLFLLCRRINSPMVQALAQDHRNDVLSNSVALICGYIGSQELLDKTGVLGLIYVDPGGAIVISLYIIVSWWITGVAQIKLLTGHTAKPDFLKKITWICLNHHSKIRYVDTVRAFHFGNNFLVEVDIVLPEEMTLLEAHDIGEPLQQKLERLPEVERAFVHLDYNFVHDPLDEHKIA